MTLLECPGRTIEIKTNPIETKMQCNQRKAAASRLQLDICSEIKKKKNKQKITGVANNSAIEKKK